MYIVDYVNEAQFKPSEDLLSVLFSESFWRYKTTLKTLRQGKVGTGLGTVVASPDLGQGRLKKLHLLYEIVLSVLPGRGIFCCDCPHEWTRPHDSHLTLKNIPSLE